ncbi:hypothetical protein [Okeania sp. KiyG1]|nr:hypothetical protein [Okeania sp. KiyG1]
MKSIFDNSALRWKIKNLIRNQHLRNSIAEERRKMEDGRWKMEKSRI